MVLEGNLDHDRAGALRTQLQAAIQPGSRVSISLAKVTHVDTAGIAVLIEASRWAKKADVCLTLSDVSEAANKVIEITRLDGFFAPG